MSSDEAPAMPRSSSNRMSISTSLSPQWRLKLLETGEQYDCSITSVNYGSELLPHKVYTYKILMPFIFIDFHVSLSIIVAGVEMPQGNFERGFRYLEGDAL
jgi:hypothetical protein